MNDSVRVGDQKISSNIVKLYVYWFFHAFIFAYVIERLYWAERGMSVQQVVYVEIIYALVIVLLEVPSGYFSDRWSRKWMMVLSAFFTCLEFVILIVATTFWHFVLVVLVAAVSNAVASGTNNAIIYDSLKISGQESKFEKVIGRVRFFKYAAAMLAALIGSVVATKVNLVSTYWLSLVSVVIAFILAFTLIEPNIRTEEESEAVEKGYIKKALQFLNSHRTLQIVLLYGVIVGACLTYLEEFWQLYVEWVGIPIIFFGIISGINMFTGSISGLFAYRFKERFAYKRSLLVILLLFTIGLLMMAGLQNPFGILFMWIAFAVAGIAEPLVMGYLHHRAPSAYRATVESFYSLALRVAIAIVGVVFGIVADHYGIHGAFLVLGILSLMYLTMFGIKARQVLEDTQLHDVEQTRSP